MNKKNFFIFSFIFLICIVSTLATNVQISQNVGQLQILYPKNDFFQQNTNFTLHFHVFNSTGFILKNNQTTCNIHIYDQDGNHLIQTTLNNDVNTFDKEIDLNTSFSSMDQSYPYNLWCNSSQGEAGYVSNNYEVTYSGSPVQTGTGLLVVIILIPLILALFMLVGAATLGEDHAALRITLFLFSPITIFISLNFALIGLVKYYGIPELQEAVGSTTYYLAWFIVVLITYFIFYWLYKLIHYMANKRKEKLQY